MSSQYNLKTLVGFTFIALALTLTSANVSAEPIRLGSSEAAPIAFSPDGTILAASHRTDPESDIYDTQVVILWDPQTQEQVKVLELPNSSLAFSPDGTLLATGGRDNVIRLWDMVGLNQVGLMRSSALYGVSSLAFSPDGKTLAVSGIELWDVQTGQKLGTLQGKGGWGLVFSPDGSLLFSGGSRDDPPIPIWDVQTQQKVGELTGPLDITYDLALSPDGTMLASAHGYRDKAVYLWYVQIRNQVGVLGGHSAHVLSIDFSPDGKFLASTVNWDDTVHIWDVQKQQQVGILAGHDAFDSGSPGGVAFSSDGKWLACGGESGVELWELDQQPREMLTELMLLVMNEYYLGNIDAELAWDSLVNVQAALAALDSDNPDAAAAAMNNLKSLINEVVSPRNNTITPEAAAEITQQADEITVIVLLGS